VLQHQVIGGPKVNDEFGDTVPSKLKNDDAPSTSLEPVGEGNLQFHLALYI